MESEVSWLQLYSICERESKNSNSQGVYRTGKRTGPRPDFQKKEYLNGSPDRKVESVLNRMKELFRSPSDPACLPKDDGMDSTKTSND